MKEIRNMPRTAQRLYEGGPSKFGMTQEMEIALVNQFAYGVIILGS